MTCSSCRERSNAWLCSTCRLTLARPPERAVGSVLVRSAFVHEGAARSVVHRLKYEAVSVIADRLASSMAPLLWQDCEVLVPVPRTTARRWLLGVDPARQLADALARLVGVVTVPALEPELWMRRRAGSAAAARQRARFSSRREVPESAVLVDDVVTTGITLRAAAEISGCRRAITATAAVSGARGAAR